MSLPAVPEWLAKRDGSLARGLREHTLIVSVAKQPHYRLDARPAKGQFVCNVSQTHSGKLIDDAAAVYPTPDAALAGGLERLKEKLGW